MSTSTNVSRSIQRLLIDNHWQLAKYVMAGSFVYGFMYTYNTGRPALNFHVNNNDTDADEDGHHRNQKRLLLGGMNLRIGSTSSTASEMSPRA